MSPILVFTINFLLWCFMSTSGYYSKEVGIIYSFDKSKEHKKDLWFTVDEFTFYIGEMADGRYVVIPKGFVTDGASVPRFLWSVFPPWGIYGQAAIVHDYLCEYKALSFNNEDPREIDQKEIDRIFYAAMKAANVPVWTRSLIYAGVKLYHLFN